MHAGANSEDAPIAWENEDSQLRGPRTIDSRNVVSVSLDGRRGLLDRTRSQEVDAAATNQQADRDSRRGDDRDRMPPALRLRNVCDGSGRRFFGRNLDGGRQLEHHGIFALELASQLFNLLQMLIEGVDGASPAG